MLVVHSCTHPLRPNVPPSANGLHCACRHSTEVRPPQLVACQPVCTLRNLTLHHPSCNEAFSRGCCSWRRVFYIRAGSAPARRRPSPCDHDSACKATRCSCAARVCAAAAQVHDAPRFSWRGFLLDCGRHYFSVPFIKQVSGASGGGLRRGPRGREEKGAGGGCCRQRMPAAQWGRGWRTRFRGHGQ